MSLFNGLKLHKLALTTDLYLTLIMSKNICKIFLNRNDPAAVQLGDMMKIAQIDLHELKGLNKNENNSSAIDKSNTESQEVDLNDHYIYISYPVDASKKHFNR